MKTEVLTCDRCRKVYATYDQKTLGPLYINRGKDICPDCYKWLLNWFTPDEKKKEVD